MEKLMTNPTMILVEAGIPIPEGRWGKGIAPNKHLTYWDGLVSGMYIGDSILVEKKEDLARVYRASKKGKVKIVTRKIDGKFRIWRVAEKQKSSAA
jgi:hypothetical protein